MLDDIDVSKGADEPLTGQDEGVSDDQPEIEVGTSGEEVDIEDTSDAMEEDQPSDEEGVVGHEAVKVEYDGVEYEIPKELEKAFLFDKDYTNKTQALGDERRAFEASQKDFQQYQEATAAHNEKMIQLNVIDQQLAQFSNIDWNLAMEQDFEQATKLQMQAQQLQQARGQLVGEIDQAEKERQSKISQSMARTAQETDKAMAAQYPNWSEAKKELGTFAVEQLGFPAASVKKAVTKPEMQALYLAQIGYKTLQKVAKEGKASKPEAAPVKPSKAIKPKRNKAPTDLSKINDPVAYREMRLRQKAKR